MRQSITQIFYWVLNMAIVGSLVACVVLLLRRIEKLPRNFIYGLYLIVLIRFLCPLGFTNGFGFLRILPDGFFKSVNPFDREGFLHNEIYLSMSNVMKQTENYQPFRLKENAWAKVYEVGAVVWIAVSILFILIVCLMYRMAMAELKHGICLKKNIYQCDTISAPMVVGMIKPKIYIPNTLDVNADGFSYIIDHENSHIKKRDNVWRGVAILLSCIYWFNPMIWILLKCFFVDMELACDETTLRDYTLEERRGYASTLLAFASKEKMIYATAFSGSHVKVRIKYALNYKEVTLLTVISFTLLFVFMVLCFLSN